MFNSPKNMRQNGTSEQCLIEIEIEHLLNDVKVITTPAAANDNGQIVSTAMIKPLQVY